MNALIHVKIKEGHYMRKNVLIQWLFAVVCVAVAMPSCINEDAMTGSCDRGTANVRLLIDDGSTRTRLGTADDPDNGVRQVRVYAFKGDKQVGYVLAEDLNAANGPYYVPMQLSETGDLNFYVLVNDNFATGAHVQQEGQPVTVESIGWDNLTKTQLNGLYFTGMRAVNNEFISPMVNNSSNPGSSTQTEGTTNHYRQTVSINSNMDDVQVVPVNVQHILARLRLMLNKEGDGEITVNKVAVRHRPDNYMLFTPTTVDVVTFDNNSEQAVDEFVSAPVAVTQQAAAGVQTYQEIGRTFLKPNAYGSKNPDEYVADIAGYDDVSKAYVLSIDYTTGGTAKHKDVYLPRVLRNQSIDVIGTLRSGSLQLQVQVKDWEDGGSFDMNYNNEFQATLTLESGNPVVGDADNRAYAVVYSDAAATRHDLTFELNITNPRGGTWVANLTNGANFEVTKDDGTVASGGIDGQPVTITIRPTQAYDVDHPAETELYITLIRNSVNAGEQIIDSNDQHPGETTRIKIRQIAASDWNVQP